MAIAALAASLLLAAYNARVRVVYLEPPIYDQLRAIALTLAREHGKTIADARGDIQRGLEVIEFACGIPHALKGEYPLGAGPGIDVYSMRQPLGIGAGITPFNFPAMVPMWFFPIAIAAGNTVVLKPSEKDPSASNWMRSRQKKLLAGSPS